MRGGRERGLSELVLDQCRRHGHKTAFIDTEYGQEFSFQLLKEHVLRVQAFLKQNGLRRGQRVWLGLECPSDVVATLLAIWRLGGAAVLGHTGGSRARLLQLIADSDPHLVLMSRSRTKKTDLILKPVSGRIFVDKKTKMAHFGGRRFLKSPANAAVIVFTSGSTGRPKGVVHSTRSLRSAISVIGHYLRSSPKDIVSGCLTWRFTYGLTDILTTLANGGTVVFPNSLLMSDVVESIQTGRVNRVSGVPSFWHSILDYYRQTGEEVPKLEVITCAGGALSPPLYARMRALFPEARIVVMYGSTEAIRSTYFDSDTSVYRNGAIGIAIPGAAVKVLSARGKICRAGKIGQIVHSGSTIAIGYWNDRALTDEKFRWVKFNPIGKPKRYFFTGDYAHQNRDGRYYFNGRHDRMVKVNGYRLYLEEVESALGRISGMDAIAVTSFKDGESVKLVLHCEIAPDSGLSAVKIRNESYKILPSYISFSKIFIYDKLPRTSNGKIAFREL